MLIHTSATKTKATTTGLIKTQRGDGSQKRSSISGAMRRKSVRDLNTGERIIASSYLGQRKRAHTHRTFNKISCVELEEPGTNVTEREVRASRRAAR